MHYINILYKGYTLTVAIIYIPILIANHSIVQSNLNGNSLIIVYYYARRFIISEHPQLQSHAFSGGTLRGWATYWRLDALR